MSSRLRTARRAQPGKLAVGGTVLAACLVPMPAGAQQAQPQVINLSVEQMVELGLRDSYRIRQLVLGVERERNFVLAQQAGLKSRVELQVSAPEFSSISEYKYNSTLQREELVFENTRRWEAELSVRQPVILLGFPTNGYLSLNNQVYRFTQYADDRDIRFYNRYFIGYNQPLFQPNRMKNDLEEAELDLERSELDYRSDVVGMIDDLADDYYELFETAYERVIAEEFLEHIDVAVGAATEIIARDSARAIEADQLRVELANAREDLQQANSSYRLQTAEIKQRLRLSAADSVALDPVIHVRPIDVDPDRAIDLAMNAAPRLRGLAITMRENEIQLDQTKGNNSFRMNVGLTYGREMQDPRFANLWEEPRNSYTVDISATIPVWDWGQRRYRIQAEEINLQRTRLSTEEAVTDIETSVRNEIRNLEEYEQRAMNMQENMALAHQITMSTIDRYRRGEVTLVDVLQTISRESSTARNFMDAYLGFRNANLRLQQLTYHDFELDMPLLDRFTIEAPGIERLDPED
jgi:outer membrane protein TolC